MHQLGYFCQPATIDGGYCFRLTEASDWFQIDEVSDWWRLLFHVLTHAVALKELSLNKIFASDCPSLCKPVKYLQRDNFPNQVFQTQLFYYSKIKIIKSKWALPWLWRFDKKLGKFMRLKKKSELCCKQLCKRILHLKKRNNGFWCYNTEKKCFCQFCNSVNAYSNNTSHMRLYSGVILGNCWQIIIWGNKRISPNAIPIFCNFVLKKLKI